MENKKFAVVGIQDGGLLFGGQFDTIDEARACVETKVAEAYEDWWADACEGSDYESLDEYIEAYWYADKTHWFDESEDGMEWQIIETTTK